MKILFVSFPYPWPANTGGHQRRFHLATELAKRHNVTLATIMPPAEHDGCELVAKVHEIVPHDERLFAEEGCSRFGRIGNVFNNMKILCGSSYPRMIQNWLKAPGVEFFKRLRKRGRFDGVWVDRSYLGMAALAAGFERFVVDIDDLESVQLERRLEVSQQIQSRWYQNIELKKLQRFEKSLPERFWRLAVCKDDDLSFFPRHRGNVFVIPNGVSDAPLCDPSVEIPGRMLFVGTMDYLPNIDAVNWFVKGVFPKIKSQSTNACCDVVGRCPTESVLALHVPGSVEVLGTVPDVGPHYENASVVVAPIRSGSGTRLKILEALGRGKAVVSTKIGAEGLDLRPGVDYVQADTPEEFAKECARLLNDKDQRIRLGQSGHQRVMELYRWESIGRKAEEALFSADRN